MYVTYIFLCNTLRYCTGFTYITVLLYSKSIQLHTTYKSLCIHLMREKSVLTLPYSLYSLGKKLDQLSLSIEFEGYKVCGIRFDVLRNFAHPRLCIRPGVFSYRKLSATKSILPHFLRH